MVALILREDYEAFLVTNSLNIGDSTTFSIKEVTHHNYPQKFDRNTIKHLFVDRILSST